MTTSIIAKASNRSADIVPFRHPKLNDNELYNGTRLGFDSWADTSCAGKHAYVEAFIEGRSVTATGFSSTLGSIDNLNIAHVIYAYDMNDGNTVLLENNNAIYMGDMMVDSLINPIQCEDNNVEIYLRPSKFSREEDEKCQCLIFDDGFTIPIEYKGALPFINVRRPTPQELDECERRELTSIDPWLPEDFDSTIMPVSRELQFTSEDLMNDDLQCKYMCQSISATRELFATDNEEYHSFMAIRFNKAKSLTPEKLSKLWKIGISTATRTIQSTTQKATRTTGLLSKRFKTDKAQLRFRQLSRHYGTFYCDYLKSGVRSIRRYIGGSLYTNKLGFKKFFAHKDERGESTAGALRSFIEFVGLPTTLHSDGHNNFVQGAFKKMLRKFHIPHTTTEPHSPWQNRAEYAIGELKQYSRRLMFHTQTPIRLWCFCFNYCADVLSLCATGRFELQGRTPFEIVTNYTPDISEYVQFAWFDWCYYYDQENKSKCLCRWLGPAAGIGQAFCSYLLLSNAEFIARSSVISLTQDELNDEQVKLQQRRFMDSVHEKIGTYTEPKYNNSSDYNDSQIPIFIDENELQELPYGDEISEAIPEEIDQPYLEQLDQYIGAKVVIPGTTENTTPVLATIKGRKRDANGNLIGCKNANPIFDTRIYQLQFPDGRVEEYGMNTILENIMSQVDSNGYDVGLFREIIDVRVDWNVAIPKGDAGFVYMSGRNKPVITTKGWEFLIQWSDGSSNWLPLSVVKESFPVQCAEFVHARKLQEMPAFKWWTKAVLKKRDIIINKVKTNRMHRKGNMKYGIIIPKDAREAIQLDEANGNTYWQDAIRKEMENSRIAFELLEKGEHPPPGYKKIRCHLNFEVKMDLRRKARYVAGGHLTDPPASMTYSSVVSRESVRIAFLIAAVNQLQMLAGDIQNAYLNAPTTEKLYFTAGPEWGADEGRQIIIVRALYGLKSSALNWRNHLADILQNKLHFQSSLADPDVWYRPMTKASGEKYYAYILIYVDDMLIIDEKPREFMNLIKQSYKVREDTIKEPDYYLGADIRKVHFSDGSFAYTMSSESYVKNAVKNIKARLNDDGLKFNNKLSSLEFSARQPFSSIDYRPELDTSAECDERQTNFFQNVMGVLRWLVELGRIDIAYEVSILSSYLAVPRTGHLQQALHIVKYIDIHSSNEITFDPQEYILSGDMINDAIRKRSAMSSLYKDAEETIPTNAPKPRGKSIQINCFVDSDHAGDRVTRRSHTGILMYLNKAPIAWFSKKQSTVESSTFGSEFVALRIASEQIISLRYKLRMFGIPIEGPANVFCDNKSVFLNASVAESRLTKKHNSVCFHRVRECVASGILVPFKVDTNYNLSDILTKALNAIKRLNMRRMIMPEHE